MIGDMVPEGQRGAAYGLRQTLDTAGAVAGPLLATVLMAALHDDFRLIFWLATIPGAASVVTLIAAVHEPPRRAAAGQQPPRWSELHSLGIGCFAILGVATVLTLGRFSEAFLILRAQNAGLALALAPLALVTMNFAYTLSAYPLGALSDRIDRRRMLTLGFATLIAADVVLAAARGLPLVMAGIALWGLHMGLTQGLLSAMVADGVPEHLRATAFGAFHFASGIALLLASLIAGILWERVGPSGTFYSGAGITAAGLVFFWRTQGAGRTLHS